ncbi:TetR/AcrR family transcriptional regulator [Lysinibacter cavernae]|uniref:AcrR family transcriptional regulator n=1 Tax=Lysinibacter cavernae TaxID=1640652 RepID=A0A7X5R1S3_9MICO|nr:TetR/AcrR family transcriptional regulator [Lysinibacter cavernae]NIH54016.1 AcrR family transcriptional regulator [Lysinibacter cavernae]
MSRNEEPARTSPRKPGRPSVGLLSRSQILDEAFALADSSGSKGFTITAIANNLGVQAPAIYNYFRNKGELISAMRGQLATRVDSSAFDTMPWHEAVTSWAHSYVATLGTHPGTIAELATEPVDGELGSIKNYENIVACFRRDGYPEDYIVPAIIAYESFFIGSALDSLAPESNLNPGRNASHAPLLESAELTARTTANQAGKTLNLATFEFGLEALTIGIRTLGELNASS